MPTMTSAVPSLVVLGMLAVAAAGLAYRRQSPDEARPQRLAATRLLAIATVVQAVHFVEEWMTGFHVEFPALLGLAPMPLVFFLLFNLGWIAVWVVSVPLLGQGRWFAFFSAWFLAAAGMLNGVAHPLLAIASGGYFPGLITSPFIGLAGWLLWQRLGAATRQPMQV